MKPNARTLPAPALAPALATVAVMAAVAGGCGVPAGGKKLTSQEQDLMRQPVGRAPMPPEAAEAMRRANQPPPAPTAPAPTARP